MKEYEIILEQLGGRRFVAMTGSNHLVGNDNILVMHLARNMSKANRLRITYNAGSDDYTMEFFRFTAGRLNKKTFEWTEDKLTEVETKEHVFCDMLQEIFTQVTGLYTRL